MRTKGTPPAAEPESGRRIRSDNEEWKLRQLRVERTADGWYVVSNPDGLVGFPAIVAKERTKKAAVDRARQMVRSKARQMAQEQEWVRANLLANLSVKLRAGRWFLLEPDFETFLRRAMDHGAGIAGIEAWDKNRVRFIRTFERYAQTPFDSGWFTGAFSELRKRMAGLEYHASVLLSPASTKSLPVTSRRSRRQ